MGAQRTDWGAQSEMLPPTLLRLGSVSGHLQQGGLTPNPLSGCGHWVGGLSFGKVEDRSFFS